MAITPLPTPPDPDSPSSFDTLAYPFVSALVDMVPEINDAIAQMGMYATTGGTANAITLTGILPAGASSVPTGTAVRFRASAANTGATTIDLDSTGAIPCRTVTWAALPPGYIRSDFDTVAVRNGGLWVLSREIERGSNGNGEYLRLADGTQICWRVHTFASLASDTSAIETWTYPAPFSNTPFCFSHHPATSNPHQAWSSCLPVSGVTATVSARHAFGAPSTRGVYSLAFGRWY